MQVFVTHVDQSMTVIHTDVVSSERHRDVSYPDSATECKKSNHGVYC